MEQWTAEPDKKHFMQMIIRKTKFRGPPPPLLTLVVRLGQSAARACRIHLAGRYREAHQRLVSVGLVALAVRKALCGVFRANVVPAGAWSA
jgi:hypothetical protein